VTSTVSPPSPDLVEFLLVSVIGAAAGASELVARYRDAPIKALASWSASFYMGINALASIGALVLVDAFGWTFGYEAGGGGLRAARILVAGFGAMALFRSSLFLVRIGNQDVGIGPSTVLQSILDAAERGVDRARAKRRAKEVKRAIAGTTYAEAQEALPALCLGLIQNPTDEDELKLSTTVKAIQSTNFNEQVKLYLLGLALLNFGGSSVLKGGVDLLRQQTG
jgi:hypothetical protein